MSKVNTRDRIKQAALTLFAEKGFATTPIAAIEAAAGLAPRAGAFYRHFDSKLALLEELARAHIGETPDEFDFEGLRAFADTRAELVSIARTFEVAAERQRPFLRLIDELRLTGAGAAFERQLNEDMMAALSRWTATKPAAAALDPARLAALTLIVFGGWLFYLTKRQHGIDLESIDRNTLLDEWASSWASYLDTAG
jgi:AcrR family transcriptional regulator